MRSSWTLIVAACLSVPGFAAVPADSLTLEGAVAIALSNNPMMRSGEAAISSAAAVKRQAVSTYYPALSAQALATHTEGAFVFNPSFPPRDQVYNSYTAALNAQWTLFDFGKTISRVSASGSLLDASMQDYASTRASTILNVLLAYFTFQQSLELEQVALEARAQAERRLTQARAFYSVGNRPQFDVVKAEVDLANENVNVVRTRTQREVAKVGLDNALGVHHADDWILSSRFQVGPWDHTVDSTVIMALGRRPDYQAALLRVESSRVQTFAAWSQHLPTLSASGAYTWTAFNFPLYSRWSAGLTISLPLFQGFSIDAQVEQSKANTLMAVAALDALRESIRLDVEQAYFSLKEMEEGIAATEKLVQQAELGLTLAERQYAAGAGTALEVSDAQLTLSNARSVNIQANFARSGAYIRLLKAAGTLNDLYPDRP